jgi:hypothetical protein
LDLDPLDIEQVLAVRPMTPTRGATSAGALRDAQDLTLEPTPGAYWPAAPHVDSLLH